MPDAPVPPLKPVSVALQPTFSARSPPKLTVLVMSTTTPFALSKSALVAAWSNERDAARAARELGDRACEWRHLERAHILSQPKALLHLRTHVAMLGAGIRRHDRREVIGQLLRLVVAGPGSLTGRYPIGNTGGADVNALTPMPIPDDLVPFLSYATHTKEQP